MQRRELIVKTPSIIAALQLALISDRADAMDPVTLSLVLGLIGAGGLILSQKIAAEKNSQAQVEIAKMQFALRQLQEEFEIRKIEMQYGRSTVVEELFVQKNGQPVKVTITRNLDGYGTEFGVNGGYGTKRGSYSGTFTTAETGRFSRALALNERMPVPTEDGYFQVSPDIEEKTRHKFRWDEYPKAIRPYSTANNPTKNGWDMATILYANGEGKVDAKIVGRNEL